ncbi:MAG: adenylyl-sulfate kinase, adenylylsulfate kinase [candidate division NC10 bacterium CSP1-5]|nr:MAG: adenylyl-sulfate kinase, adenylylsulfate kinase [candidate division NC10 bacterium CSP1-5]
MPSGFAVWITGLPASGKSTVAAALKREIEARGVTVAILESDSLRQVFTPHPLYTEEERDVFYGAMVYVGRLLTEHEVPVIFDATGNRRKYRERARQQIPRFVEVYVDCPLDVCVARDPKGIYRRAREGAAATVPGFQAMYEPPENPEIVVRGDEEAPEVAARRVAAVLVEKGYLPG